MYKFTDITDNMVWYRDRETSGPEKGMEKKSHTSIQTWLFSTMNIESEEEETIHWIALNQLVIYKEGREKMH